MFSLWLLFFLIAAGTVAALLMPVLGARSIRQRQPELLPDEAQSNLALYTDRKKELELDLASGTIDADQHSLLLKELDSSLLQDDAGDAGPSRIAPRRWAAPALAILTVMIPLVALLVYLQLGSVGGLRQAQWLQDTRTAISAQPGDVEAAVATLERRLAEDPDNPEGWLLLGRTLTAMQQYSEAAESYTQLVRALQRTENNSSRLGSAWGLRAEALFFRDNRLTPDVQRAVEQALANDPEELNALSLLGIASFQAGQYERAAGFWERILALDPEGKDAAVLRDGIARARQLASGGEVAANTAEPASSAEAAGPDQLQSEQAAAGPAVVVKTRLSEAMAEQLKGTDLGELTLFVLAKAPEGKGPPMPLAVVKTTGADLPAAVTLSDSNAMTEAAKLSMFPQVDVIARLSRSGSPIAQAGDIEGRLSGHTLTPGAQTVELLIDTVIATP
ncbi:c-type cytochrome biogenesis protein CcmI [Allohahella marinimesophila]|uniref:C-type cytochrome biogenesis protein CcmI n=1 Tax=Allohahella marinimesophila TaxID=1054972 RepID=A0ABP7NPU1_9GAMM